MQCDRGGQRPQKHVIPVNIKNRMEILNNLELKMTTAVIKHCSHSAVDVMEDGAVAHSNRSASVYFYICPSVPASTTEPAGSRSSSESITALRIGLHPIRSHDTESALLTSDSAAVCTSQSRCIDFCRNLWFPKQNQTSILGHLSENFICRMQDKK